MFYEITWTIQLSGKNPVDAAKAALQIMQDKNSTATVFNVKEMDSEKDAVTVDLLEMEE